MRRHGYYLSVILAVALSVGLIIGCGDDNPTDSKNGAPSIPAIDVAGGAPADSATGQPLVVTLRWTCSDPDGDPISYNVYFDSSSHPSRVDSNLSEASYQTDTLDYQTN